jgi:ribonuclease P protein component
MTPVLAEGDGAGRPIRLKKRPAFLRAAGGRKVHAALFTLQGIARPGGEAGEARVGFTVTKKVGGAVERNRIKRRLREAVRITPGLDLQPTHDYVIVARRAALEVSFASLTAALAAAVSKLHRAKRPAFAASGP